jgi:hypothetical protein
MPPPPPVQKVPADQVGDVVQTFVDAGCTQVTATKNFDGTYTVAGQ